MAFREVDVTGIREALRARLAGQGLCRVAEQAGADHRKTARLYVRAAEAAGLIRDEGVAQLTDELIDQVVQCVRRRRAATAQWLALRAEQAQIAAWVKQGLTVVKIDDKLARRGVVVPYRTLHA